MSSAAASATDRAMGPAVSWLCAIGTIPVLLTSPTVGLMPTRPLTFDGETIDPSVSVPTPTAARFAATATPVPELEPEGLRSRAYGLRVCPPRPLQPLDEWEERKFAHSLRLVFAISTAPASRRRVTMNASRGDATPASAREPAEVFMRSPVAMLSLMTTGMPWSGPRTRPALRSVSICVAIASASGFTSMMLRNCGPPLSTASILARYCSTSSRDEVDPADIRCCRSAMVNSSRANRVDGVFCENASRRGGCDGQCSREETEPSAVRA